MVEIGRLFKRDRHAGAFVAGIVDFILRNVDPGLMHTGMTGLDGCAGVLEAGIHRSLQKGLWIPAEITLASRSRRFKDKRRTCALREGRRRDDVLNSRAGMFVAGLQRFLFVMFWIPSTNTRNDDGYTVVMPARIKPASACGPSGAGSVRPCRPIEIYTARRRA
jgi:hypothetical protein